MGKGLQKYNGKEAPKTPEDSIWSDDFYGEYKDMHEANVPDL